MRDKKYLFIMCPPFQGSTLMYRLINTSTEVSTFLNAASWMGEGQCFISDVDENYSGNRWNKNYDVSKLMVDLFHKNWDMSKNVLCDKSPPNIIRSDKIYEHFSKKGEVYFIIQTRDPYTTDYGSGHFGIHNTLDFKESEMSYKLWDVFAKIQHDTYQKYKDNSLLVTYEDLCDDIHGMSDKILNKFPFLNTLKPEVIINGSGSGRMGKLNKVTSIKDDVSKTKYLTKNSDLLNYFNYKLK